MCFVYLSRILQHYRDADWISDYSGGSIVVEPEFEVSRRKPACATLTSC